MKLLFANNACVRNTYLVYSMNPWNLNARCHESFPLIRYITQNTLQIKSYILDSCADMVQAQCFIIGLQLPHGYEYLLYPQFGWNPMKELGMTLYVQKIMLTSRNYFKRCFLAFAATRQSVAWARTSKNNVNIATSKNNHTIMKKQNCVNSTSDENYTSLSDGL